MNAVEDRVSDAMVFRRHYRVESRTWDQEDIYKIDVCGYPISFDYTTDEIDLRGMLNVLGVDSEAETDFGGVARLRVLLKPETPSQRELAGNIARACGYKIDLDGNLMAFVANESDLDRLSACVQDYDKSVHVRAGEIAEYIDKASGFVSRIKGMRSNLEKDSRFRLENALAHARVILGNMDTDTVITNTVIIEAFRDYKYILEEMLGYEHVTGGANE